MIQRRVTTNQAASEVGFVTVSNGEEFFLIPESDLEAAEGDGFYRPEDRGLTIIGDEQHLFEVPLADAKSAIGHGFRDLLAGGLQVEWAQPNAPHLPQTTASSRIDSLAVIDGLQRVEQEAEQELREQLQQLDEAEGLRRYLTKARFWLAAHRTRLKRQLGGSGISLVVHVAVLMILASLFLVTEPTKDVMIMSSISTDELVQEVTFEAEPIEIVEPSEETETETTEVEEVSLEVAESVETPDFMAAVSGEAVKPPAKPEVGDSGDAMPKAVKKPTIFGSNFNAINYVFVIDNSNSMTNGRFETALHQLMLTVSQLTPKQRFYVIFYSDTAYPMMHPQPVRELVPANQRNKNALGQWLNTVQLCLKTNGMAAIQAAFDLEPDVIYVLGDGAFTDGAAKYFVRNPHDRIVVHSRGMEVSAKNAEDFRMLAEKHRGTYKDVGVSPEGLLMSKQYPRRRNSVRGPIWGVTLPLNKKK